MLEIATQELLSACWRSASQSVGGAGGTVGSLARALALDEAAERVAALIELDYLERDGYGVVWVTATGAPVARAPLGQVS